MGHPNAPPAPFEPCCLATTIGSLPHIDATRGMALMFQSTPEIPSWVQFPRRAYHENMRVQFTLYPAELRAFLARGGCLGWGIVPTLDREAAAAETIPSLLARFEEGVERLVCKGIERALLPRRALITPSCGAGGVLDEPLAERVLGLLRELSVTLRQRHGFADRA